MVVPIYISIDDRLLLGTDTMAEKADLAPGMPILVEFT